MTVTDLPEISQKEIGENIRIARVLAKMTRSELAAAINETERVVTAMEQYGRGINASRLAKLAYALGQEFPFFYTGIGTTKPTKFKNPFRLWGRGSIRTRIQRRDGRGGGVADESGTNKMPAVTILKSVPAQTGCGFESHPRHQSP